MMQNMACLAADGPQSLKWSVREVTVGPEKADVVGNDSRALQKAADMLAFTAPEGRGTLRILPGTYVMRDSLHIRQPMKIVGTPGQTILVKAPAFSTTLAEPMSKDAVRLTVADASGLRWDKAASRITLRGNVIRDTRPEGKKTQKTALHLHPDSQAVEIAPDNQIEGAVVKP